MRSIRTIVAAAILLFFCYVVLSVIVDGYLGGNIWPNDLEPDAWSAPDSWSEWRDITIVFLGFWFVLAGILMVALLAALVYLVFTIRRILNENVAPAVDSAKQTLENLRGTSEFVGENAVSPIIRTVAVVRGVRSGISAVTNLPDRIKGNRKKKGKK